MRIAVIGSINVDLMYNIDLKVKTGETSIGRNYQILDGGKGANQAVMLSALAEDTVFLGAVGDDAFAENALKNIESKNLSVEDIVLKKGNTGLAVIEVYNLDNSIVVFPGVNRMITKEDVDVFLTKYPDIGIMVLQLEISMDIVEYIVLRCSEKGIKIILNPAPAAKLSKKIIDLVDFLIPNETETMHIFGSNKYVDLVEKYKGKLLITLGEEGVLFYNGKSAERMKAFKIKVSDTTGAGDAFVAGFAYGTIKDLPHKDAVQLGVKIASIACSYYGAQTAYEIVKGGLK